MAALRYNPYSYGTKQRSPAMLRDWRELPCDVVEREEISTLLQQAVETLPHIYRQVFLLRHVQELNVNETAQVLDISTSQVKVRLYRARMMLQKLLAPKLKALNSAERAGFRRPECKPLDLRKSEL